MRALLCVLLAAGLLQAQGTSKKPVFNTPEAQPGNTGAEEERDEGADAMRQALQALASWPSPRARRAAERLIVLKERSLPAVVAVLVSADPQDAPLKPGAAFVVGRIGSREHLLTLLLVAAEKEQHGQADVFLEAALRIDHDAAVAEAFRYFHLAETTLRHQATKFVLNNVTADNLDQVLALLDRRTAEHPYTREIGLRLLDRLVETGAVRWTDERDGQDLGAGQYFYRALGDESPQVASRAMRLLAGRNDAANLAELNNLITKTNSYWRQRSYAALALGLNAAAYKTQPFTPETLEVLRGPKMLTHPKETLARAAAALALAQVALRTSDRELVRLLDREIPIVLIDAVGARHQHYRDFSSVMPLAYTMLRRITGENLPDHAPRWAEWWRDHGRTFRAKRELAGIDPEDLPDVEVEIAQPRNVGGDAVRFTVVGPRKPTFLHGHACALPRDDMEQLVGQLRQEDFFTRAEADEAALDPDAVLVTMRVGDLDRRVAFEVGDGKTDVRNLILARAQQLEKEYAWQAWWDVGAQPSWDLFFLENRKWFKEHTKPEERAPRLRAMAAGSLPGLLAVEDRVRAVRFLEGLPGGGGALTPAEVDQVLAAAGAEREVNEFTDAVVDLLVPAAGEEAADRLIVILADAIGLNARVLLTRLCESLGFQHLSRLAGDERWKVRRAAVAALAHADAAEARPLLVERLGDTEILVRVEAAEALARRRDEAVLPALRELAGNNLPEVRANAAYAYGLLGGAEARAALPGLLYEDRNADVRARAIDGIVEGKDPEGAMLLVGVFRNEGDGRVRAAAASGIVALETPELVDRLLERLQLTDALDPERVALVNVISRFENDKVVPMLRAVLNGDDNLSADAAALGLSRRWEDASLLQLIKMVRAGDNARTAVRHLQMLTNVTFEADSFQRQAENYTGWARTHQETNPRQWFLEALEDRSYDVAPLKEWAGAELMEPVPDEVVPLLLRALRDKDWFIQRNAAWLLSRRIGPGAPKVIDYSSPPDEVEAAIRAYHDWWRQEEEARKAREQG